MKKNFRIIGIILMMVLMVSSLVACSKEEANKIIEDNNLDEVVDVLEEVSKTIEDNETTVDDSENASTEGGGNVDSTEETASSTEEIVKQEETTTIAQTPTETSKEETTNVGYVVKDMKAYKFATSAVNVRSGPGTTYDKIGSLATNNQIEVTGQADNGWFRILYKNTVGFVSDKYLSDEMVKVEEKVEPTTQSKEKKEDTTKPTETPKQEETTTPTPEPTTEAPTPKPTTPAKETYTKDEVISAIKKAMQDAGLIYYPDSDLYAKYPEYGPDGGMGWGEVIIAPGELEERVQGVVEAALYTGHQYFYIEYGYTDTNETIHLVVYSG